MRLVVWNLRGRKKNLYTFRQEGREVYHEDVKKNGG
jgi:hypothetical protein